MSETHLKKVLRRLTIVMRREMVKRAHNTVRMRGEGARRRSCSRRLARAKPRDIQPEICVVIVNCVVLGGRGEGGGEGEGCLLELG